jgi:hypothetical protein
MQLAERALETLNFALVIDLLSLGELQRLEHFLHFIERMFEFFDDSVDLLDGITDGGHFRSRFRFLAAMLDSLDLLDRRRG